jgi:electron transfer flavoprotein alpha subunit
MGHIFRLKHRFFASFREIFVHHHGSLHFRAKVFALVIAANEEATVDNYILVKKEALKFYEGNEDRASLLTLATKELVQKIKEKNGMNMDSLVASIVKDLKIVPRYAAKIDTPALKPFIDLTYDEDSKCYQKNILHFLETIKQETRNKSNKTTDINCH